MPLDPQNLADELRSTLGPISYDTAAALAEALKEIPADPPPSGTYVCGCPWDGAIIPHFCPKHHQPPIFEFRGPRK
jgi:hypothetical protein